MTRRASAAADAGAGSATPILVAENVTMRFGGLTAVDSVNFRVNRGEIMGLIGPNGAGKTTFFNCLTGLYLPTTGRVVLQRRGAAAEAAQGGPGRDGADVPEHPAVRQHDRAGERDGRPLLPDHRRTVHLDHPRTRSSGARRRRPGSGPRSCSTSSGSATPPTTWPATCPTATSGGWRSPAPWPPTPSCCCWTSRPPG